MEGGGTKTKHDEVRHQVHGKGTEDNGLQQTNQEPHDKKAGT